MYSAAEAMEEDLEEAADITQVRSGHALWYLPDTASS